MNNKNNIMKKAKLHFLYFGVHETIEGVLAINTDLIGKLGLSCAAYYTEIINIFFDIDSTDYITSVPITMDYFFKTLGITRTNQQNHRRKLENLGIVKVKRQGLPPKLHFTLDVECEHNLKKLLNQE